MWIDRDIAGLIEDASGEYIQILTGPRQCGKSSLLWHLGGKKYNEVTFDDLQMRTLAETDPSFFLARQKLPLIIDEVQYAPNIFPELKKTVDSLKRNKITKKNSRTEVLFRLTGSNQILMDKNVKETLVGRAGYYYLNTLSVSEILKKLPKTSIDEILFKGGWPELYTNSEINPVRYINDYIRNFIEKDIVLSSGISKQKEFNTVLGMLAARTGEFINYSTIAGESGVKSVTVKEWVSILERTSLIYLLQPAEKNLNKRLIRSPKIYFLDTGLATRLQGWSELEPLLRSSQAGHLFETLVLGEIIKFNNNFGKNFKISAWRTKDGEEIDFVIDNGKGAVTAIDSKLGIHSVHPIEIPVSFQKAYPQIKKIAVVSFGGDMKELSPRCIQVPISRLKDFLMNI